MIMNFLVYHVESGRILRNGQAPQEMVSLQAAEGEGTLVGMLSQEEYYIGPDGPIERPVPIDIPAQLLRNAIVPMIGVFAGATVTLTDAFGIQNVFTFDPADPLILTDAGSYTISIQQPFPAHCSTHEIGVVDA